MNIKQLQNIITDITIWKKSYQRKLHKPLTLLYVLTQYKQVYKRLFDYRTEIKKKLLELLSKFALQNKTQYLNMPFWRLKSEPLKQLINDKLDSKPQFVE